MKFKKGLKKLLKKHLHNKLYRNDEQQKEKWINLLNDLTDFYELERLNLVIDENVEVPFLNIGTKTINLNKYSLISLLHEFAHFKGLGHEGENNAWNYSQTLFKEVYPKGYNRLTIDEKGYLIKKDEH